MLPLPLPDGVTVHHDWLLLAVQLVLDVTVKVVKPAISVTIWLGGVTDNTG